MRRSGLPVVAVLLGLGAWSGPATARSNEDDSNKQDGVQPDGVKPDNTAMNKRDTDHDELTADQQSNSTSDVRLTAKIRRAIMKNKSLSTNGHNVKIIVAHGSVTLKGPVASADEKSAIEHAAVKIAGRDRVACELSVQP